MGKIEKFTRVTVDLSDELAAMVREAMQSGDYFSEGEIVREALYEWAERQQRKDAARERLRAEIDKGLAGPFVDGEEAMARLKGRVVEGAARRSA